MVLKPPIVLLLLVTALGLVPCTDARPGGDVCLRALGLLHDGRFDEAEEVLDSVADAADGPRIPFFRAFVTYWRLLYDDDNHWLQARLERQLHEAIASGTAVMEREPADADAKTWTGSSRLLLAQLHAARRDALRAAFEAKRAKRLLEVASRGDRSRTEAYFGLGTYNYYASRVSAIVKGIRFLLALPGGDRDGGIAQLERVSRESPYFGVEASILLMTILSSRHERRFDEAEYQSSLALERIPASIALLHASGVLDLSLARHRRAVDRLGQALARAALHPRTDSSVEAHLRYHLARGELALFRPDRARLTLAPLLSGVRPVPESLREDLAELAATVAEWTRRPQDSTESRSRGERANASPRESLLRALPALELEERGDAGAAAEALLRLAEEDPTDATLAMLAGRAFLLTGRGSEAFFWLARAESSPALPRAWLGPCRLMAGQAADLAGRRKRAIEYYRRAIEAGSFPGRDAAYFYRDRAYGSS